MSADQKTELKPLPTSTAVITKRLTPKPDREKKHLVKDKKHISKKYTLTPSEDETNSFLQDKGVTFSKHNNWLAKWSSPEDTLTALANTLCSLDNHFSSIIELEKLPAFVDSITKRFIDTLVATDPRQSPPIAEIFIATDRMLIALGEVTRKIFSQISAGNKQAQLVTIPLIELLTVLLNIVKNTNQNFVLTICLNTPQLLTLSKYLKTESGDSPTLDDLGQLLGIIGRLADGGYLTNQPVIVESITQLLPDHAASCSTSGLIGLLYGFGALAEHYYLKYPLPMAHLNPLLEALSERKDFGPYAYFMLCAIFKLNQLLERLSVTEPDSLDINALEDILAHFTKIQLPIGQLASLLDMLSQIFNRIKSPIKLYLEHFIDALAAVNNQLHPNGTSIESAKIIRQALLAVGSMMRNRLYLYADIEGSRLPFLLDSLHQHLLRIAKAHPTHRQLLKDIASSLYATMLMSISTKRSKQVATLALQRFEKLADKYLENPRNTIANQLMFFLCMARMPRYEVDENQVEKPKWPKLEKIIDTQKPIPNQFQLEFAEQLSKKGFTNVRTEEPKINTYSDSYAETVDGMRIIIEFNGFWFHHGTRIKEKKDGLRKMMMYFLDVADYVHIIELGPLKKFDSAAEIQVILAKVKEFKQSKGDAKEKSPVPADSMQFYQFIVQHLKLPSPEKTSDTLPEEPTVTTKPTLALETPLDSKQEISLLPTDLGQSSMPERKKSISTQRIEKSTLHPAYQLTEAARQGDLNTVKNLLKSGIPPHNPCTRQPDPYTVIVALMVAIQTEATAENTISELRDVITRLVNTIGRDDLLQEKYRLSPIIVAHMGGEKTQWIVDLIREKLIPTQLPDKNTPRNKSKNKQQRKYSKEKNEKKEKKAFRRKSIEDLLTPTTEQLHNAPKKFSAKVLFKCEAYSQQTKATPAPTNISPDPPLRTSLEQEYKRALESLSGIKQDDKISLSQPLKASETSPPLNELTLEFPESYKKDWEFMISFASFHHGRSLEQIHELAIEGNATAQCWLGLYYLSENPGEKNADLALRYLEEAAAHGFMRANYFLGALYQNGIDVPYDIQKAVTYYKIAAENGLAYAQVTLAECYIQGTGVDKDPQIAFKWYQKAASQGHALAQYNVGVGYEQGIGIPRNLTRALYWFEQAAQQGNPEAQHVLAGYYYEGLDEFLPANRKKAIDLYYAAAKGGVAEAQLFLAKCYLEGKDLPQNIDMAFAWYEKAAKQGLAMAETALGLFYYNKGRVKNQETVENMKTSFEWYQKAAKKGNVAAQYALGKYYEEGIPGVVEKNIPQAINWYAQPEALDLAPAQDALYDLANGYLDGDDGHGIPKDPQKAADLFEILAKKGHGGAQFKVGLSHEKNNNMPDAMQWFWGAAKKGYAPAIAHLKILANNRFDLFTKTPQELTPISKTIDDDKSTEDKEHMDTGPLEKDGL